MKINTIADLSDNNAKRVISTFVNTLAERYDQWLNTSEADSEQYRKERPSGIHASEIAGCMRKLVYNVNGTKPVPNVPSIWKKRFEVGHAFHNMIQTHFEKMASKTSGRLCFERELEISPEKQQLAAYYSIYSHADGVFTFKDEDLNPIARCLLEIKTASPAEFEGLSQPKKDHMEQIHVYMAVLDVPITWMLYWHKGNQNYTKSVEPFLVKFDSNIWNVIEGRINLVHTMASEGTLPPAEPSGVCDFCPFAYTCKPPVTAWGKKA